MGKDLSLAIKIGGKVAPSLKGSVDEANSTLAKISSGAAKVGKIAAVSFAAIGTAVVPGRLQHYPHRHGRDRRQSDRP